MLAIALFVDCHKDWLLEKEKSSIEEKWISCWKDNVGQPTPTPQQVIEVMDWDCWPTSGDDAFADE